MQVLEAITIIGLAPPRGIHAGCGDMLSLVDLPFNPLRLIFLIGWVYLCMYLVQRSHFSPLVPPKYKTAANVVTLLTGPFLLLTLFLIDTARKSRQTQEGFLEILKRQVRHAITAVRSIRFGSEEEDTALHLLDSTGRSIDEICGHGDAKRVDTRILSLTEATICDALDRRASDILIDPKDQSTYPIRLRIDGALRIVKELDADTSRAVINSIKVVAAMDIAERRRPQDG
ncbi:MAG: ATPase, T2SS/T4P/T4SS family, partial [Phycisphaerales bacterium]